MPEHWYLKSWTQARTLTGEVITAYTNVPCHLWMRWTLINPKIHPITRYRRGLPAMDDWYYCFDQYHDNEQTQPGDTTMHTFVKEPWPYCQERWFYFHGNIGGIPSPSTSPIFYKHPIAPLIPPTQRYEFNLPWQWAAPSIARTIGCTANKGYGTTTDFIALSDHPLNQVRFKCQKYIAAWPVCGLDVRLYAYDLPHQLVGPILTQGFVPITDIPPLPGILSVNLDVPIVNLTEGHRYAWIWYANEEGNPNRATKIMRGQTANYVTSNNYNYHCKTDQAWSNGGTPYIIYFENWIIS